MYNKRIRAPQKACTNQLCVGTKYIASSLLIMSAGVEGDCAEKSSNVYPKMVKFPTIYGSIRLPNME